MAALEAFMSKLKQSTGIDISIPMPIQNMNVTMPNPQDIAKTFSGIGQVNQYNPYNMPSLKMQMNSRKTGESLLSQIGSKTFPNTRV